MKTPESLTKVQAVVRALEVDIVLGRLYPRERLVEEQLAKRFGTTRHVIRQALIELEGVGLLIREANKGATVCEYSAEEVEQLYQVREILESQAARLIPLPIGQEPYERLKAICEEHAKAISDSDMLGVVASNKAFHQELFRLCGNSFLADVIDEMAKRSNLVRFTSSTNMTYLKQASDEHYQVLEVLRGNDNEKLAALCIEHLQPSRRMYQERRGQFR